MTEPNSSLWAGSWSVPDRYQLHEVVSRGMEGQLWRASLLIDNHPMTVAVKEIQQYNTDELEAWTVRWERQADLLRSLDHPGLVRVREVLRGPVPHRPGEAVDTESLYLVMNWANGVTMADWTRAGPDLDRRLDALARVAAAVDHLHDGADTGGIAVLHRDLKPANVIVDDGDQPRLVDFGFARLGNAESDTIVGSPNYMAPELVLGVSASPASDRFSFGATAFFVLTGATPGRVADENRRVLESVHGGRLGADTVDGVLALLDPDPARRPTSLGGWQRSPGHGESTVPRPDRSEPSSRPPAAPGAWFTGENPAATYEPPQVSELPSSPPVTRSIAPSISSPPRQGSTSQTGVPLGAAPLGGLASFEPSYQPASHTSYQPFDQPSQPPSYHPTHQSVVPAPANRRSGAAVVAAAAAAVLAVAALAFVVVLLVDRDADSEPVAESAVPVDLTGLDRAQARAALEAVGLEVEEIRSDEPGEANTVADVDPPAGSTLEPGATVRLYVFGEDLPLPSVKDQPFASAVAELTAAGFSTEQIQRIDRPDAGKVPETVINQNPDPERRIGRSAPIELYVAVAPTTTTTTTVVTTVPQSRSRATVPTTTQPPVDLPPTSPPTTAPG